ncbi:hypothetical protein CONPUDRAFT_116443 [Coniophora puteana RWD-64-598 SS2]|uniref:VASt domain-containing protein n=1 Tax=Coniophora puteana (strain RWD-64-598) TaxID=741705 RepID=A0A5M3N740_CONPW|nr:uncharacterized protein CONPUDRAFT_116443 [Coniophora puteana RWD-64-598 SS2]EIW87259.1 hypothetical protein CONPUDRAFT_116443 [Coniophora puteana RWD-64-598 SS2]
MPSLPYTRQRTQTMPATAQPPQGAKLSATSPDDKRRVSGASGGGGSPTTGRRSGARTPDSTSTRESVQIGVIPPSPRAAKLQFDNAMTKSPTTPNANANGGGAQDVIGRDYARGPNANPTNANYNNNNPANGVYGYDPNLHQHQQQQAPLRRPKSQERSVPDRHALSYAMMRPATADALGTPDDILATANGSARASQNLDEWGGFVQQRPGSRGDSSSRALTPASSTGNLRGFVDHPRNGQGGANGYTSGSATVTANTNTNTHANGNNGNGERLRPDVQRRTSSGRSSSSRSQTTPLAIDVARSNADPMDTTAAAAVAPPPPVPDKQGLVESPTQLTTPHAHAHVHANQNQNQSAGPNESTSALSHRSATSNNTGGSGDKKQPKKKKSWVSATSPGRKGTGIAGALAASGMAMAHPGSSQQQQQQQQQQQSVPPVPALPARPNPNANANGGNNRANNNTKHTASASVGSVAGAHRAPSSVGSPRGGSRPIGASRSDVSVGGGGGYDSAGSGGGFESEEEDEESDEDDDDDELGFQAGDIPVTGFAVASSKRNADFHELFPSIPEGDYLIEDYGCALQREILIQGRLYISENHICFHANIFGWITDLSIPMYEITSLEKKMTAFVIPNAIQLTTRQAKYTFASFLARDTAHDVIANIWRLARPEIETAASAGAGPGASNGSFVGAGPGAGASDGEFGVEKGAGGAGGGGGVVEKGPAPVKNKVTQCACAKSGGHYTETALETVVPGTPDKIYNLMFASGFIKDFMRVDQKLLDVQIADWAPMSGDSKLLARTMSYIKPLNNTMGPKQTKCEIRDETVHCDFDEYVVMLTTTRTPDVPSGGVFSVKTRTCLMWAGAVATRVVVTTQVEWTGRSFIKGVIERSAIDGQKVYHADLDKAMRMYIQEHASEFIPSGVDPTAVVPVEPATPAAEHPPAGSPLADGAGKAVDAVSAAQAREHERNARGLQWAYETFEGAYGVATRSTAGALELLRDAWDQSSSTTILYFVIVVLVLSNVWTLALVGRREEVGRRKEARKMEERERWVQGIVTGVWEEMANGRVVRVGAGIPGLGGDEAGALPDHLGGGPIGGVHEELGSIERTLDAIEDRVKMIRGSLHATD